jgi:4-amino-4-deoxy-L-arabinose transferase-like glycosyltransferase
MTATGVIARPGLGTRTRLRVAQASPDTIGFAALLLATAAAYLFALSRNGFANEYYAAAVQAGSQSWKAWFFGSFDASSFITVDKTPASLWVMGLSARLFGFGVWSMLVPQALMGVGTVALLYVSVRRWFSAKAALIAGAVLALTPVAVLMFRFNNPDALLVLLLVAGAWAVTRAIDSVKNPGWWMALAGVLVGFGFLTKMLQAFLVLPAFGLAYLVAGRPGLLARLRHCAGALLAMVVAGGWWVAIVELMPASARPYIGGSQTNSVLELTLGYNGLGRLTGEEAGSVGGRGGWGGATGLGRLFGSDMGTQISWLLPAAIIGLVALAVIAGRAPRTDRTRAFAILWGGWLLVTGAVFSYMEGIIHSYYMVALAPAVAALVGAGAVALWRRRGNLVARTTLAGAVLLTAAWSYALLNRTPEWYPWLRNAVLVTGMLAALAVLAGPRTGVVAGVTTALMAGSVLAGPAAYAADTIGSAHAGALPTAGPAAVSGPGGFGGRGGPGGRMMGPGGPPGASNRTTPPGRTGGGPGGGFLGGAGTSNVSSELVTLLRQGASGYRWAAAAMTANGAAPLQIAAGVPVMAIGGFNGTDPSPTLAEFQQLVADGTVHYFVANGNGRGGGASSEISAWVAENFTATTVGGYTVYDLST